MLTKQEAETTVVSTSSVELENLITGALKKVGSTRENDLCRYIPGLTGGYMHHFTLKKMKNKVPGRLSEMIRRFILDVEKPVRVSPKQRAARGSKKKKGSVVLSENDALRIMTLIRGTADRELLKKLNPHKDPKALRRALLDSIKKGQADQLLWNAYAETIA
jgi:hypothetical protein